MTWLAMFRNGVGTGMARHMDNPPQTTRPVRPQELIGSRAAVVGTLLPTKRAAHFAASNRPRPLKTTMASAACGGKNNFQKPVGNCCRDTGMNHSCCAALPARCEQFSFSLLVLILCAKRHPRSSGFLSLKFSGAPSERRPIFLAIAPPHRAGWDAVHPLAATRGFCRRAR